MLGIIKHYIDYYLLGGKKHVAEFEAQRVVNQQHRYDYPAENNRWIKMSHKPVYGTLDTGAIFDPQVIEYDDKLLMSVSERKTGSIILLRSSDAHNWQKECVLLPPRRHSWEHIVTRSCLLNVGGIWHLWYTGQQSGKSAIGHLVARSYHDFVRQRNNKPVLAATMPLEGDSVMNPCVLWNNHLKKFQMWYAAGESYEPDRLFYTESEDGDSWVKHPTPVMEKEPAHPWEQYKVGGCDVILLPDGTYEMYYIGYQNVDVARICYATSTDGIQWQRTDNNLCLSPSPDAWDADAVYKPSSLIYKGKKFLWYNGRSGNQEYIGVGCKEI